MGRSIDRSPVTGITLALALIIGTIVGAMPAAADIPFPDTVRISASNAVDVGTAVSQRMFANDAAGAVVLTRSDKFPDGLAASALAGEKNAPVLFTPSNRLDSKTRAEIDRVLPDGGTVYLMGGPVALDPAIESELDNAGYFTVRIGGDDRDHTAALTARFFVGAGPASSAILVRGRGLAGQDNTQGWPDAISCGGYAANTQTPVLLTDPTKPSIPQRTVDALRELGITRVHICGGPAAVPNEHAAQLSQMGISVARYAGDTRATTAIDVSKRLWPTATPDGADFLLINGWGENFAYGIAAAPFSGKTGAPILIVDTNDPNTWPVNCSNPPTNNSPTLCYLNGDGNDRVASLTVIGSTAVISDAVHTAAARAAGLPEDKNPPSVPGSVAATDTPEDDGTNLTVTWAASTDDTGGDIAYAVYVREASEDEFTTAAPTRKAGTVTNATSFKVTGLTAGKAYDVAVTATDQFGNTSALSAKATATPTDEAPAAPTGAPNTQNVPTGVTVSWLEAPEADVEGYLVERARPVAGNPLNDPSCDGDEFDDPTWAQVGEAVKPKSKTSFTDTTVQAGNDYCYRYKIFDTSGNTTAASPHSRISVRSVTGDSTAPTGTPTFYAVYYDQVRGSTTGGVSRSGTSTFRVDVVVPAGSFEGDETNGNVQVYVDDVPTSEEPFEITGTEQVVSATVTTSGSGTKAISVALEDLDGNSGPRSDPWQVAVNTAWATTPRIVSVEGVDTDPLTHADGRIPIVGGEQPQIDATPRIVIADIPAGHNVHLYNNNTDRLQSGCRDGQDGSTWVVNANEAASDLTVTPGTSNFVAISFPCDPFFGDDAAVRSGDSNTVTYVYDNSVFGIEQLTPGNGDASVSGFSSFEVRFNQDAQTGPASKLTLRDVHGTLIREVQNNGAGDGNASARIIQFTESISPGVYTLTAVGREAAGTAEATQTSRFTSGFVGYVHIDASQDSNGAYTTGGGGQPVTLVVAEGAPAGQYRAYRKDVTPSTLIGTVEHQGNGETRTRVTPPQSLAGVAVEWDFQPTNGAPTSRQSDGTVPAKISDVSSIGVRQFGLSEFILDGIESVATGNEVYYRPSNGGFPSQVYTTSVRSLAKTSAGAAVPFQNDQVQIGWEIEYIVRDVVGGNYGPPTRDGSFYGVSSITPANGLGNSPLPPSRLQPNDTLQVDFQQPVRTGLAPTNGTNGGLIILDGSGTGAKVIGPNFGGANGATAELSQPTNRSLLITFKSQSTYDGAAIGSTGVVTSGPTQLHGGDVRRGVNWLIEAGAGHVFILPVSEAPVSNPGTF